MLIPNQSNVTYNSIIPNEGATAGQLASNTVNTENLSDSILKISSSDKTLAKEGEIVHNKVVITNNSQTKLSYTFIGNYEPKGASFVANSVKLNGVVQQNKDMYAGFYLPDLNPGDSFTIEYDLQIDNPSTVNPVIDRSQFKYYVDDPVRGNINFVENLEPIKINIVSNKLNVVKSVDKAFATKGETLTYTITFTNDGNVDIDDIYFTDNIPQGTTFVENSVKINGSIVQGNRPDVGYNIAKLTPSQSATTSFKVTIN